MIDGAVRYQPFGPSGLSGDTVRTGAGGRVFCTRTANGAEASLVFPAALMARNRNVPLVSCVTSYTFPGRLRQFCPSSADTWNVTGERASVSQDRETITSSLVQPPSYPPEET